MEPTEPDGTSTSDLFFDALDSFPPPNPEQTLDSLTTSHQESITILPHEEIHSNLSPENPPPSPLLRRRSSRERRNKILLAVKEHADASSSTLTSITPRDQSHESSNEPPAVDNGSLFVSIASLVIKAIFFQINLLFSCVTLPIRLVHCSFLLLTDPFGVLKRVRDGFGERFLWIWKGLIERISPLVYERRLVVRLALGCCWSFYVVFVLFGILATAFLGGSLLMRWVVEEPVQMMEDLNFDYTKPSPDAFVPLISRSGEVGCNLDWGGKIGVGKDLGRRVVPMNHKMQLILSFMLPESDYNRNLGVFQVRAEFLSANGKVTYSSSQPCMLRFKSSHIHFIETFLKSGTLLAGYSSESQVLRIRMAGFTEGTEPTVCVRVILEQRAEYRPGAGIPEIYAASLKLESELPLLKRIIWNWRRTVFIWVGMGLFILELLIVLVCCRPVIVPRARPSGGSPSRA